MNDWTKEPTEQMDNLNPVPMWKWTPGNNKVIVKNSATCLNCSDDVEAIMVRSEVPNTCRCGATTVWGGGLYLARTGPFSDTSLIHKRGSLQ
jgi:hypothetical protein